MTHLTLSLLGTFEVLLDGKPITGFVSGKARALLVYLTIESERPHRRSQLAELLWPEWPERVGRTYLRHALSNLRQLLGDTGAPVPFLLVTRDTLQFNHASTCDVDVRTVHSSLANALQQQNTNAAEAARSLWVVVTRYQWNFLEGFFVDGCTTFDEWVLLTRERLQRHVLVALQWLAAYEEQIGDYEHAQQAAQRLLEIEPWLEEAHRQLIRVLALSGQRSAALMQYERCCRILQEELGVAPTDETQVLAERIRAGVNSTRSAGREEQGKFSKRLHLPQPVVAHPSHLFAHDAASMSMAKHNLRLSLRHLSVETRRFVIFRGSFMLSARGSSR